MPDVEGGANARGSAANAHCRSKTTGSRQDRATSAVAEVGEDLAGRSQRESLGRMATLADLVNVSGVAGRDEQIGARFDGAADLPRGFGEGASEVRFAVLVPDGFCELVLGDDCEKAQEIARVFRGEGLAFDEVPAETRVARG